MSLGKKFATFATVVGVMVIGGGFASAGTTGTQTVTYSVNTTRSITVVGDTIAFGALASTETKAVAAGTTTDSITWSTNSSSDKITVQVAALTSGVDLKVKGDNVDDGNPACTSPGTLDAGDGVYTSEIETERTFISGISECVGSTTQANVDTLTYQIIATDAAGVTSQTKTVTYTIKAT